MALPETVDVAVVGVGPTGAGLLWKLSRSGLRVAGIEQGASPLAAIAGYLEGLVFVSTSAAFELEDLPFDCFDPAVVTREEVLHYFARVINRSRAPVISRTRLAGIAYEPDGMLRLQLHSAVRGEWFLRASRCVITGWFKRREIPRSRIDDDADVEILDGVRHPIELAGEVEPVAVIGAGLSGRETALSLMRSGLSVCLVAQREAQPISDFLAHPLTAATASRAVVASDLRIARGGIQIRERSDVEYTLLPCRRAVTCLGQEIDRDTCAVLVECGVLTSDEVERLAVARTADDVARQTGERDLDIIRDELAGERPDLWDRVVHGHRGVHLAGGALHGGGSHAGLSMSLLSVQLVAQGILGQAVPDKESTLFDYLFDHVGSYLKSRGVSARASRGLPGSLRPIGVRARNCAYDAPRFRPLGLERSSGMERIGPLHYARLAALLAIGIDPEQEAELVALCDGSRTIGELLEMVDTDASDVLAHLELLLGTGVLSWLP